MQNCQLVWDQPNNDEKYGISHHYSYYLKSPTIFQHAEFLMEAGIRAPFCQVTCLLRVSDMDNYPFKGHQSVGIPGLCCENSTADIWHFLNGKSLRCICPSAGMFLTPWSVWLIFSHFYPAFPLSASVYFPFVKPIIWERKEQRGGETIVKNHQYLTGNPQYKPGAF